MYFKANRQSKLYRVLSLIALTVTDINHNIAIINLYLYFDLSVALVIQSLREPFTERLLQFIVLQLEKSRHLHFYLLWCHQLLTVHGQKLKLLASKLLVMLRSLQKSVTRQQQDLNKV